MNFDNKVKNKTTEFICKHGDETMSIKFDYDIETINDIEMPLKQIISFLGFDNSDVVIK